MEYAHGEEATTEQPTTDKPEEQHLDAVLKQLGSIDKTISATLTPTTIREVAFLTEALRLPTEADAITAAVRIASFFVREIQRGAEVYLESPSGALSRLNAEDWFTNK